MRLLGLLDQPRDAAVGAELGDAELRGVGHLGQQHLGVGPVAGELVDQAADAADDQVVAEVHDERLVAEEVVRDEHGVRQTTRRVLADVRGADAQRRPVADGGHDLVRGVADDDADLGDAGVADGLEAVEQDRLVGDRHELLGRRVGDRAQPGAGAAGEDQCLHNREASSPRASADCQTTGGYAGRAGQGGGRDYPDACLTTLARARASCSTDPPLTWRIATS